ncbi:hypothetical protein KBC04_00590 [Candidatus Babeliales bacterium]|nr:hypothetical protein [Candidatus Babeliales bacterium]MBP9843411.1 hypothetical protein [Candidatus Babeliales bacterium]
MNIYKFIKKISLLSITLTCYQLESTIKTFVNDSSKTFVARVYDNNNKVIMTTLTPGAIQDVFISGTTIEKIVIQDERHVKKSLSAMTRQTLRKESSKINDSMVFIIHQDSSIKMYKGTTSRNEILNEIDATLTETGKLPTLEMMIHNTKTDEQATTQNISYAVKYGKSV